MKPLFLLPVLLLMSPTYAAWEVDGNTSKKSWFYAAYQDDKNGTVELQFYCDYKYPGDVSLLVFTGEDFDPRGANAGAVDVYASIDGTDFDPLQGYNDSIDGERIVVVDSSEDDALFGVVRAVRSASQPIVVHYAGGSHRFGAEGAERAVGTLVDGCL